MKPVTNPEVTLVENKFFWKKTTPNLRLGTQCIKSLFMPRLNKTWHKASGKDAKEQAEKADLTPERYIPVTVVS